MREEFYLHETHMARYLVYSFGNCAMKLCIETDLKGCLCSTFFSSPPRFLAKQFQLHALSSRKKGGVVKAPKEVLHELQFFVELLHSGVCEAEFVEQCQTPP